MSVGWGQKVLQDPIYLVRVKYLFYQGKVREFWKVIFVAAMFHLMYIVCFLLGHVGRAERDRWSLCHQSVKKGCHRSRWWRWVHHDREESSCITRQTTIPHISVLLFPVLCESRILLMDIIIRHIFSSFSMAESPACDLQMVCPCVVLSNWGLVLIIFCSCTMSVVTTFLCEKWQIASLSFQRVIYIWKKNLVIEW